MAHTYACVHIFLFMIAHSFTAFTLTFCLVCLLAFRIQTAKLRTADYHSAAGLILTGNGQPLTADYASNMDNGLLVWQMTAQQDAALLADETAFVRRLQRAAGIDTSKEPSIF